MKLHDLYLDWNHTTGLTEFRGYDSIHDSDEILVRIADLPEP